MQTNSMIDKLTPAFHEMQLEPPTESFAPKKLKLSFHESNLLVIEDAVRRQGYHVDVSQKIIFLDTNLGIGILEQNVAHALREFPFPAACEIKLGSQNLLSYASGKNVSHLKSDLYSEGEQNLWKAAKLLDSFIHISIRHVNTPPDEVTPVETTSTNELFGSHRNLEGSKNFSNHLEFVAIDLGQTRKEFNLQDLAHLTNLTGLTLINWNVSSIDLEGITRFSTLELLDLSRIVCDDLKPLETLTKIRSLNLSQIGFNAETINFKQFPRLEILHLNLLYYNASRLTPDQFPVERIKELSLERSTIVGIYQENLFSETFGKMTSLEKLNIAFTRVTKFERVFDQLPNLRELTVDEKQEQILLEQGISDFLKLRVLKESHGF